MLYNYIYDFILTDPFNSTNTQLELNVLNSNFDIFSNKINQLLNLWDANNFYFEIEMVTPTDSALYDLTYHQGIQNIGNTPITFSSPVLTLNLGDTIYVIDSSKSTTSADRYFILASPTQWSFKQEGFNGTNYFSSFVLDTTPKNLTGRCGGTRWEFESPSITDITQWRSSKTKYWVETSNIINQNDVVINLWDIFKVKIWDKTNKCEVFGDYTYSFESEGTGSSYKTYAVVDFADQAWLGTLIYNDPAIYSIVIY